MTFLLENKAASAIGAATAAAESSPPITVSISMSSSMTAPASFWAARLFLLLLLVITISFLSTLITLAFEPVITIIPFILRYKYFAIHMFCTFVLFYIIEQPFVFVKGFFENLFEKFAQKLP